MRSIFTLLLLLLLSCSAALSNTIISITNGEFAPYNSQHLKYYGLASKIVTEAFALEGIEVEYGFFPWNRSYWLAERGVWDGSAVWQSNPTREKDFFISDTVHEGVIVFFHLKSLPLEWNNISDLGNFSVGATIGYTYTEEFDNQAKSGALNVDYVKSDALNFTKLLNNRIEVFPCEREVAFHILQTKFTKEEFDRITFHPKPVKKTAYKLLLSKQSEKNEYLLYFFNRGLKKLKQQGMVDEYIRQSNNGEYISR